MPERRRLDYDRLEAVMPDVECLLASHSTVGVWTLGQILDHLAKTVSLTSRPPRTDATPDAVATPEQDAVNFPTNRGRSG